MTTQEDLHDTLVGPIVRAILCTPLEYGGTTHDVLVILESVIVGVMFAGVRQSGDEIIIDALATNAKQRLAALRLGVTPPAGTS
ncbi:MAG: hypothetical protein HZA68_05110 [Rhodovulum sp.]|nr:hypothetical protein [Rhodovulum sp.]